MQSSTITWQNISLTDASFNSVDRAVSLAADNVTCTVTPVAALTAGTQYIVTVSTGVKDLTWKFNGFTIFIFIHSGII